MTSRALVFFVSIGVFFAAVLLVLYGRDSIAAILLIACGAFVAVFNHPISDVLQNFSSTFFGRGSPLRVRPFTLVLWGIGIALLGVISLVYD
jgi:hypothetical protein